MRAGACVAGSALVLTPVALTGCGAGGTRPLDVVVQAARKTSQQPSEHMTIYATIATGGRTATVKGSGDFRNHPLVGRMQLDAGAVGAGDISIDEIVGGRVAYLSSDGFFGELPPGTRWMAIDDATASGAGTAAAAGQTPLEGLAQLRAAGDAKKIGDEDVDGVRTTHYSVTIDPSKIPTEARRAYRSADVWIDGRGLVRQEMLSYSEQAGGAHVSTSVKIGLSRFGRPVSVQVPSRDEASAATGPRLNAILNGGP
jgi:hypothetical protein